MRFTPAKTLAVSVCTVALLSAVSCSSDDSSNDGSADTQASSSTPDMDPSDTPEAPSAEPMADPAADLVGPGCAAYAKAVPDGKGSVSGMAEDPVATAASNNPLLTTLVSTVNGTFNKKVNLVDTLNGGEFTVFAPTNDAFAKLDKATLTALAEPKNAAVLQQILTYHVVAGQVAPADIDGMQKTVEGKSVEVAGSGNNITVNGSTKVLCGGVHTANATVYLVDSVLLPPDLKM